MLTDSEAIIVAQTIARCFSAIADCEQDLHAARRTSSADVSAILSALGGDLDEIESEIAKLAASDDVLLALPQMSVRSLLHALDQITLPKSNLPEDTAKMARWLAPHLVHAQMIDDWLEPVFNVDMDLHGAKAEIRDAFSVDGHILLEDNSLLLPRSHSSWRNDGEGSDHVGLFARFLRNLAYIPSRLNCDDPDALTNPGPPIAPDYRLWNSTVFAAKPLPNEPVIAVAPLAECGSDITFIPSICRTKYALRLSYDEKRFAEALSQALDQGVHILLVPEMALPEGDPADFDERMRQLFLDVRADHFDRTGQTDELRLVLAGVLGGSRDDGYHRNYAVAFDADGAQPHGFRQLKLSHWNLTHEEQDRFGITFYQSAQGALSNPIIENSLPADRLFVLDIPGVGRTATLICADMSQNNPGDWLGVNAVLDWLYAPIMDKSICWQIARSMGKAPPWIVERSYRSARLTGAMVISTNSLSLSRWVNEANRRGSGTWPLYDDVGIGLAIDGRKPFPSYNHLLVGIDSRGVLTKFTNPVLDWQPVSFL